MDAGGGHKGGDSRQGQGVVNGAVQLGSNDERIFHINEQVMGVSNMLTTYMFNHDQLRLEFYEFMEWVSQELYGKGKG